MIKHTFADIESVLREMDPAPRTMTDGELQRASDSRERILSTPSAETARVGPDRKRRRRGRTLVALVLAATAAVGVPATIGGGTAFASWTATPTPLSRSSAAEAAATCQAALGTDGQDGRTVIAEKRGGWTYVLIDSPGGESACLMPEGLIGSSEDAARKNGFFGTFDAEVTPAPALARDRIVETESMAGSVPVSGRLPFTTTNGWFTWVSGSVGDDVASVTVDPPVGPDVQATVSHGRFSAWWPSGVPGGDNPGVSGSWSYTVTLADGTTRPGA